MNDNKDPTRAVVLVVEDEPSVRLMEVDMLDGAGFEVCAAASVSEALAVLDERQDVTVLVSDVQMPGRMNGIDLAKHVRETRPAIAVLLVSGCRRPGQGEIPEEVAFLAKPCPTGTLITRVRAACMRPSKSSAYFKARSTFFLNFIAVSLFDLKARFSAPTHMSRELARAGGCQGWPSLRQRHEHQRFQAIP